MGFLNFVFRYPSVNVLVLVLLLSIHGFLLVQSQDISQPQSPPPPPPPAENVLPPPPPPISMVQFSPTPPEFGNTLPTPPNSQFNPPLSPLTPPPPPAPSSPPPPPAPSPPPPPPPPISKSLPPSRPRAHAPPPQSNRRLRPPSPPPPPARTFQHSEKSGLNTGKTVGLVFAGFAAVLQICVVAFLVFKRKQLLRMTHTY